MTPNPPRSRAREFREYSKPTLAYRARQFRATAPRGRSYSGAAYSTRARPASIVGNRRRACRGYRAPRTPCESIRSPVGRRVRGGRRRGCERGGSFEYGHDAHTARTPRLRGTGGVGDAGRLHLARDFLLVRDGVLAHCPITRPDVSNVLGSNAPFPFRTLRTGKRNCADETPQVQRAQRVVRRATA